MTTGNGELLTKFGCVIPTGRGTSEGCVGGHGIFPEVVSISLSRVLGFGDLLNLFGMILRVLNLFDIFFCLSSSNGSESPFVRRRFGRRSWREFKDRNLSSIIFRK